MFRNYHNSKRLSGNSGNPVLRWRSVFIALALAFMIGGMIQAPTVQAAPARVPVKVYMDVVNPKTTICVGKEVNYEARVYTPPRTIVGIKINAYALPGIKVEAFSQDKSVGDFVGAKKGIRTRFTGSTDELLDDEATPHTAYFTFKAKEAGKTTLYFEGVAQGQYVSFNVPVKVINCKYKVLINSRWKYVTPYGTVNLIAITAKDAFLLMNEENLYSTTQAEIVWVETTKVPRYREKNDLNFGTAEIIGQIGLDNKLEVKLNINPVSFGQTLCGAAGCGGSPVSLTADPLRIIVPASGGGAITQIHGLTGGGIKLKGPTTVYVFPIEK
jgi:hypothetical protein